MHRDHGQLDFAEAMAPEGMGRNARLEAISDAIDWSRLDRLVSALRAAAEGRKASPPLAMLRIVLLRQWRDLLDPRAEEALSDSLSMRRFAGLGLGDGAPDRSTISRFRKALREAGRHSTRRWRRSRRRGRRSSAAR